jgi:hypothetical protein
MFVFLNATLHVHDVELIVLDQQDVERTFGHGWLSLVSLPWARWK